MYEQGDMFQVSILNQLESYFNKTVKIVSIREGKHARGKPLAGCMYLG